MVQLVTAEGEEGLLSRTLAFNGSPQDIKVAWGDHYSDIVRASLFPSSQASAFPASPSFPPSATHLRRPSPSLCLPLSLESLDRGATEREEERERERDGGKRSLLIRIPGPFQRHLVANPFRSRRISTRTRPWKSGRGLDFNRANFLPLLHGSFSPPPPLSPQSLLRFNRRLRDPPFENGRGEKNLLMDRSLIRTREETSLPLPPTPPPFPFISRKLRGSLCSRIAPTDWSSRIDRNPRRAQGAPLRFGCDSTCVRPNNI